MTKESHKIAVRVEALEWPTDSREEARTHFWNFVRQGKTDLDVKEYSAAEFEVMIEANFGLALKERLIEYFGKSWQCNLGDSYYSYIHAGASFEKERKALAGVFFKAKVRDYQSLNFDLEITGIKKLVELFENNFTLFSWFLSAYVPISFDSAIEGYRTEGRLRYDFNFSQELYDAFEDTIVQPQLSGSYNEISRQIMPYDKYRWIWLVANGSLLVPVLLSLGLLYVAYKGTTEDRKELSILQRAVYAQQETQLRLLNDQIATSQKREEAMYKFLVDRLRAK